MTHLVACRFELASSMSGSGDGFGDFEDDCKCDESCASGVSNLFMFLVSTIQLASQLIRSSMVRTFRK